MEINRQKARKFGGYWLNLMALEVPLIKEAMIDYKENFTLSQRKILKREYEKSLESLLNQEAIPKSETEKQLNSFRKAHEKNQIFTFLEHPNIPLDNNGSKRAIKNVKVKLKVSGQFKSF